MLDYCDNYSDDVIKVVSKHANRSSNELQTAMSALENAISMLGTVTATTRAHAADVGRGELEWTAGVGREEALMIGGPRWRTRTQKSGDAASAELSNTLSLLDSTIVAIDSAMSPPSSRFVTSSDRLRVADPVAADFRRSDVTSGLRPSEMYPWRYDSRITSGGGNASWRSQAWSRTTQLDKLPPVDNAQLDIKQPGTTVISVWRSRSLCISQ